MNADHLTGRQFESVTKETGEQVQLWLTWRGQPVHPVTYFQELKHGRVLGALCVRVVQLQNQVTNGFWVKVHTVAKDLDAIDFHVTQALSRICHFDGLIVNTVIHSIMSLYPTAKVNVDGFKEGFPLVAQCQSPVITLKGQVQLACLPVWETVLVDRDVPALRVAPSKRVDVESKSRLKGAVFCKADLEGYSKQHVDHVGLVLVALQCQEHPLSPRWVKPAIKPHVIADKNSMDLHETNAQKQ